MSPIKESITKPIAVYTRVSEQGRRSNEELLSHDIQRQKVKNYLKGVELRAARDTFEDTDKSGGTMSRPAFDRAVAGVLDGTYGGIAVASLSRLGRTTIGVLTLIKQIEDKGGVVICLNPRVDTSSPEQRAMLTVFLAFVTLEREQAVVGAATIAERKLAEGTATGGTAPIGYEFEVTGTDSNGKNLLGWLVPNADSGAVREILEGFADGSLTVGGVADALNAAGILTRSGNPWKYQTAQRWLKRSEVYTGTRVYGERRVEKAHDALITSATYSRIKKRLAPAEVEGRKTRVRGAGYALGQGLIRCGKCGNGLTRGGTAGVASLRCNERGSGHPTINLQPATDYVADVALRHWGTFNYQRTEGGNVEAREQAEAVLRRALADLHEAEEFTGQKLSSESKQGRAVAEAQAALDALDPEDAIVRTFVFDPEWDDTAERFAAFDPPTQRRLLRALGVEKVVLRVGVKGSPADRLQVEFTDGTVWNEAEHEAEQAALRGERAEAEWAEFEREHPEEAAKAQEGAKTFLAAAAGAET